MDAILEAGIRRVVVGSADPNPLVAGKGIRILREHGIEVTEHMLEEECDRLNEVFFHYIQTKRPFVVMKYAKMCIRDRLAVPVEIQSFHPGQQMEVDSMLLKMADSMDAFVVTNDFNLNKVAEFQGVRVLNINELSNAVKPVVLPGEEMVVTIIKAGKEAGQGVAYLNDGTMIVVDGGSKHIGETITVIVTSVLQTAAGRMIFTKMIAAA